MNLHKPGMPAAEQASPRDTPRTQVIPGCCLTTGIGSSSVRSPEIEDYDGAEDDTVVPVV
jgi:hypothetical protein